MICGCVLLTLFQIDHLIKHSRDYASARVQESPPNSEVCDIIKNMCTCMTFCMITSHVDMCKFCSSVYCGQQETSFKGENQLVIIRMQVQICTCNWISLGRFAFNLKICIVRVSNGAKCISEIHKRERERGISCSCALSTIAVRLKICSNVPFTPL